MKPRLRLVTSLWEGIFAADFTLHQVRQRCYHLGDTLLERGLTCLVAYDTRFMSNLFAQDIYRALEQRGVPVSLVPAPAPLPAVQLALDKQQADVGLYVSARNRPFWYNGLVLLEPGGEGLARQFLAPDNDPARDAAARDAFATQPFPITSEVNPAGSMFIADSTIDTRKPYLDMLVHLVDVNLIRRATLTIFVDPMHGTTAGLLPGVIGEGSQTKAIEINRETDPLFGRGTPLPSETGLARLRKLVRESDSHLGLAFSADGTSLGVVDKNGNQLGQLEVVLLLASYLMHQHRQSGVVVAPPPGPNSPLAGAVARLGTWENVLGFRVELIQESTQRINEILSQEQPNLLLGCTLQGELIVGSYHPYPDALIAGLFITELVARNGGSLRASLDKLLADLGA